MTDIDIDRIPDALSGVRALLVEDDPDGNELLTLILERHGARVTAVVSAAAALEAFDNDPPDILISDIGLPHVDGIQLIQILRARPCAHGTPAIALTAYATPEDAARVLRAGFDAHMAKPVRPEVLGLEVARLVANGRVKP